jgi:NitT/TauT family transport system permease protein
MMRRPSLVFKIELPSLRLLSWADAVVFLGMIVLIYIGIRFAFNAPIRIHGPKILLAPSALPWYAGYSIGRMAAAYALSLIFSIVYGYAAVRNRHARQVLLPLLDVLQSVPILSFLPVVLLSLSSILPQNLAAELASIILIFTSQVWNMTFAWYQSLITIPRELLEAGSIFRFNGWFRFKIVQLPFAAISLIWNSIMSWAGGWFFLMAAEIFSVGQRDFRLPGLGAYLQEAANQRDFQAIAWGVGTLILVIVALDQLAWRPLLAWSDRFKLEMVESDVPHTSWFYDILVSSRLVGWFTERVWHPLRDRLDMTLLRRFPLSVKPLEDEAGRPWFLTLLCVAGGAGLIYGIYRASGMLMAIPSSQWVRIGLGVAATFLRVQAALVVAMAWTVPLGVAIGTNTRLATLLQPLVQIAASVPATALFPIFLLFMLHMSGGLNLVAVFLMLMGTQWYLLFNVIAGASAIPQDLKYTTRLLKLNTWDRWRTLILPALFPYIVTGAIAASGGAWNASIVAERVDFGGKSLETTGIGSLISKATASGDYPLLLASTLALILTVVMINRLVWRRLYRLAEERYHME